MLTAPAWAIETVKVVSGFRGDPRPKNGSGMLFRRGVGPQAKHYVLTSNHVVFHGNGDGTRGYEHSIWYERAGRFVETKAIYLASEEGNGLALLEIPAKIPGVELFPKVVDELVPEVSKVTTTGYPYGSRALVTDSRGIIALFDRTANAGFALPMPAIVIAEAAGEFGMSGGPVIGEGGALVGILSNKWFRPPGQPGTPVEWRYGQPLETLLIPVPGPAARDWVEDYFRDPVTYRSYYWFSPDIQDSEMQVRTGEVWQRISCNYDNVDERYRGACQVAVERSSKERDPHARNQFRFFKQLADYLHARPELVYVSIMGFRSSAPGSSELILPKTFPDYFELMPRVDRGELVAVGPLTYHATEGTRVQDYDHRMRYQGELRAAIGELQLQRDRPGRAASLARLLLERLRDDRYGQFPRDFWLVKPSDFDAAIAETQANDERMRASLVKVRDALAKLAF